MKAQTAGWAGLLAVLFGLQQFTVQEHYRTLDALAEWRADAALLDTVTYGDARIVYTVASVLDTHIVGTDTFIRRLPDLTAAPAGAKFEVLWKPTTNDSVMLVTGDTFALSPTDSATAVARSNSWGVSDPHTIDLAWHTTTPNEPSHFVVLTEFQLSDTTNEPHSDWNHNANGSYVTTDATAPRSPTSVGAMPYVFGHTGGSAADNWYATSGADIDSLQSDSVYIAYYLKVSENWIGHPSNINKVLFVVRDGAAAAPIYTVLYGSMDNELRYHVHTQGLRSHNIGANQPGVDSVITRGQWYKIEHLFVLDTLHSGADQSGIVKTWLNGTLIMDYDSILLWDSTQSLREWNGIKWNPTWGGTGSTLDTVCTPGDGAPCGGGAPATDTAYFTPGDTMHQWLDHLYMSGNDNT